MASLQSFLQAANALQPTKYSELMSSTLILFDHLITLGDEVDLIWRSSWSAGKLLFLLNRYYTLASVIVNNYALFGPLHSASFCHRFFQWQGWTGLLACMIAESILQMRLYALYSLNRNVLILMVTTFLLTSATAAAIMGVVLSKLKSVPISFSGTNVCLPLNISPIFYTFWIPILTFETVLFCLALFRGYQTFRTSGSPFQSGRKLVGMLIRDSVVYFLVMFVTYLANLLVFAINLNYLEVPIGWSIAFSCVLGNRVILNVRREVENPAPHVYHGSYGTATLTHDPNYTSPSHTISRSRSLKGKGKRSQITIEIEHESETLTDLEMTQLRNMQRDEENTDPNGSFVVEISRRL